MVPLHCTANAQAIDEPSLARHFAGSEGLLPLWIAEPYVPLAPAINKALKVRADQGWYGYETRPSTILEAFWSWMLDRHQWNQGDLHTLISPSVGTSIGVLLEQLTGPGDGIILQPPVFTDFKALVHAAGRRVVKNPLVFDEDGYRMDLDDLAIKASDPATTAMILCNPHNPVGRVWSKEELSNVAAICAQHNVFLIADEIHADLALGLNRFTPLASIASVTEQADSSSRTGWAALHGPIKTFGLAGVCDTLLITDDDSVAKLFEVRSSQLHLTRNNVFALTAFEAAYTSGGPWLDGFLKLIESNAALLRDHLPEPIRLIKPEGTYLAWLDFRRLEMTAPDLADWLAGSARLGLSPGHWFGREGAGFARMSIAAPTEQIHDALTRLQLALSSSKA